MAPSISEIEFAMSNSIQFWTFLQNPALRHHEHEYVATLDLPLKLSRFDFFFDSRPIIALTSLIQSVIDWLVVEMTKVDIAFVVRSITVCLQFDGILTIDLAWLWVYYSSCLTMDWQQLDNLHNFFNPAMQCCGEHERCGNLRFENSTMNASVCIITPFVRDHVTTSWLSSCFSSAQSPFWSRVLASCWCGFSLSTSVYFEDTKGHNADLSI